MKSGGRAGTADDVKNGVPQVKISGRAWVFGDNVNTDVIIPGRYLRTADVSVFGAHAIEGADPGFSNRIQKGDILVTGRNFGCGSSREQAPLALREAGVSCVVAGSVARIFFRNSINVGLPVIECAVECESGDNVEVDLVDGIIRIDGRTYETKPLPGFLLEILMDGGLIAHRRRRERGK